MALATQNLEDFCRQVRAQSQDHLSGMEQLCNLPGLQVSILRQELDSMVSVIFLLGQADRNYREQLIAESLDGIRWKRSGKNGFVTDREMVELAQGFHGWTKSVYKFGCAFIHLSNMHDYMVRDPLVNISNEERQSILEHLRHYHGGPNSENPSFHDIVPYPPRVLEKVAGNLECYLVDLETNSDIT